jgi:hypothetical protein
VSWRAKKRYPGDSPGSGIDESSGAYFVVLFAPPGAGLAAATISNRVQNCLASAA